MGKAPQAVTEKCTSKTVFSLDTPYTEIKWYIYSYHGIASCWDWLRESQGRSSQPLIKRRDWNCCAGELSKGACHRAYIARHVRTSFASLCIIRSYDVVFVMRIGTFGSLVFAVLSSNHCISSLASTLCHSVAQLSAGPYGIYVHTWWCLMLNASFLLGSPCSILRRIVQLQSIRTDRRASCETHRAVERKAL